MFFWSLKPQENNGNFNIWHTRWEINHPMQHGSEGGVWPLRGAWRSLTYSLGNKNTNSWIKSLKFYTERNATKRYQMGFRGLMHMYIFGSVWHENLTAWRFTCRRHWEDAFGIFQKTFAAVSPSNNSRTLFTRTSASRTHTGRPHTVCQSLHDTHTQTHTHNWSWESGSVDNTPLA